MKVDRRLLYFIFIMFLIGAMTFVLYTYVFDSSNSNSDIDPASYNGVIDDPANPQDELNLNAQEFQDQINPILEDEGIDVDLYNGANEGDDSLGIDNVKHSFDKSLVAYKNIAETNAMTNYIEVEDEKLFQRYFPFLIESRGSEVANFVVKNISSTPEVFSNDGCLNFYSFEDTSSSYREELESSFPQMNTFDFDSTLYSTSVFNIENDYNEFRLRVVSNKIVTDSTSTFDSFDPYCNAPQQNTFSVYDNQTELYVTYSYSISQNFEWDQLSVIADVLPKMINYGTI